MSLVLRCLALNDQAMTNPLVGRFDERGGTLGRSDTATLTLPDPGRMISRLQAQVLYRDGQYWIENVSDVSPVLHNGHPVGTGMQVVLREGDELGIGGYSLQAGFEDSPESDTILRGRTTAADSVPIAAPVQLHPLGVTAGMRAVLEAVLDRVNPKKLEALLDKRALLDYLPMYRKGHLWELHLKQYDALREEAQGDLQRSLGEMFRAAYESQVRSLDASADETILRTGERTDNLPPKGGQTR